MISHSTSGTFLVDDKASLRFCLFTGVSYRRSDQKTQPARRGLRGVAEALVFFVGGAPSGSDLFVGKPLRRLGWLGGKPIWQVHQVGCFYFCCQVIATSTFQKANPLGKEVNPQLTACIFGFLSIKPPSSDVCLGS